MKNAFKILTPKEEIALSREELIKYYEQKNEYYKNLKVKKSDIIIGKMFRGLAEKIGRKILTKENQEIVFLSDIEVPEEGCIIAANHWGINDVPFIIHAFAGEHSLKREMLYPLGGVDVNFDLKTKLNIKLLGATGVNRLCKESRQRAQKHQTKLAARGLTVAFWGEGIWNFTDSKPINPFWPGITYCAKNSGKPVLPFATTEIDDVIYIKVGKPMIINPWEDIDIATKKIEDKVAQLVCEIWGLVETEEKIGTVSREEALRHGDKTVHKKRPDFFKPDYEEQFLYRPDNPYGDRMPNSSSYEDALDPSKASHAVRNSPCSIDEIKKKPHYLVANKILYQVESGDVFYKSVYDFTSLSPDTRRIEINPDSVDLQTFTIGNRELFYNPFNGRIFYDDILKDMEIDDYKDYDISVARAEVKRAMEQIRLDAAKEPEDVNRYDDPLRLIRRKTVR